MLHGWTIALVSFAYLGLLFAIAFYGDRRAAAGASIIASPYVYALSLAVYATTWTFYGSVGRAAVSGIGFLPIYLGPTLMAALWWIVLRKMIRISKANRITSIADFIASRYGKSALLGGMVSVGAVVGVVPYIALQLKAVSSSLAVLTRYPDIQAMGATTGAFWSDTALYLALLLAAFTILFGTRHLDASERHEGMVAAIAFESLVKLLAFLAVGLYVGYVMYDGLADLFRQARALPALASLLSLDGAMAVVSAGATATEQAGFGSWAALIVLSMLSILCLPRQFQIAVVENIDERHVARAIWLLPLYLLVINIFVLPIALAGRMHFPDGGVDADMFVLILPLLENRQALALLVFIGGLSAATAMIIVETIALSTMLCNDVVMPLLLRAKRLRLEQRRDLSGMLLNVRRGAILLLMLLGYAYSRLAGEAYALVSIGLISFAAVAQFGPAMLGGMFWKNGTRSGALAGLSGGFLLWAYTLLLPSFAQSGWLPAGFIAQGPFGIEWLRPRQLFGLQGLDQISHGLFWSMLANLGGYVGVSLWSSPDGVEKAQALLFVNADMRGHAAMDARLWRGRASGDALLGLLRRFLGPARAEQAYARFLRERSREQLSAGDAGLVRFAEIELAGAIGAASARAMVASVVDEEPLGPDEVLAILDETSQVIAYSRQLEKKSRELEAASAELRDANARLTELDRLKDDFLSTVTHELRTPLTSIRAFSEILRDHPELALDKRIEYLDIVIRESERLTRLINDVLDLAKIEAGRAEWHAETLDLREVIDAAVKSTSRLFEEKNIHLTLDLPHQTSPVLADRDRLMQVMLNLLSNAAKFCDPVDGRIGVSLQAQDGQLRVAVRDNGAGVRPQDREIIFEKFRQGGDTLTGKPQGTGLGLPISRRIISHFGGKLWLEDAPGGGARFVFTLPAQSPQPGGPMQSTDSTNGS
ncbi:sensor histidine kinase [Noviherbaspirillum sedimenti]|uniref:histidine kinase n=1 Tax=Noviherbaspirillum sedimenti TaxID=2320865 RepID=A0A3A3G1E2_9BURK|nr:sensor histidine kinase [Noviherbaspirillum sedimenti]RJG00729.1 histidine kinase [Noviherbaspirillum sedimenti]